MRLTFLGTGCAWGLPNELSGDLLNSALLNSIDPRDRRLRTSLLLENCDNHVLIDCGPDFRLQRINNNINHLDYVLISHPHQDHIGGLDDLFPYMYSSLDWNPLPFFIHKDALDCLINKGLGFMFGSSSDKLLNPYIVRPGVTYVVPNLGFTPFSTSHGSFAPGSVGYIVDSFEKRFVYTSDFGSVVGSEKVLDSRPIDVLVIEANWFNEPVSNPWGHMSFQSSLGYIKRWDPLRVYFTHIGNEDSIPDDPLNSLPTKRTPINPLPVSVPRTHCEWEDSVRYVLSSDKTLSKYCSQEDLVSYDGLILDI